jgi:N6-L-threonylcarbamoyladenine synthase
VILLGIESSCDETSAAVVRDGRTILSNVILSQDALHQPFRGVVPEIASRAHLERVNAVVEKSLSDAGYSLAPGTVPTDGRHPIDAVAVTVGPGLIGSLLVGKMTAEALSWAWGIPLVGVNHLEAHLLSPLLEHPDLEPPFLGMVVSGGHTDLIVVRDYGRYEVLGRTRDDSAGESFDKVAGLLGLGYPGGPIVDRLAASGNPKAVAFPRPRLPGNWDFSFSGLKTAVLYHLRDSGGAEKLTASGINDLCASFQAAVIDVLVEKAVAAAAGHGLKTIGIGGGVSANSELRKKMEAAGTEAGLRVCFPSRLVSTDNAAMIAAAGFHRLNRSDGKSAAGRAPSRVDPSLPISNWS